MNNREWKNVENNFQDSIDDEFRKRERYGQQEESLNGMYLATVVDTADPLKQGRVRFYTPFIDLKDADENSLPWASPISPLGGFDDSGCLWVPPAGSRIAVFFLHGSRDAAFYVGTIWYRNRGKENNLDYFGYPIPEFDCLWRDRRDGYLVGNDNSDVFPPWNTESYNGYDTDSNKDFYNDPSQYNATTYPYIKGFKTEEKHMLKFVEGDPRCNRRWKRVELASGRGNYLMFKDDHLHTAGQWAFGPKPGLAYCHQSGIGPNDPNLDTPNENPCCDNDKRKPRRCFPLGCVPKSCPDQYDSNSSINRFSKFQNPYYKRTEEMRPHRGANTPLGNKCELDQSGVQLQSISGHQVVLDDSVNQPTGVPTWDRDFDFGCDDTYRGKLWIKSATGHRIELNDQEEIGNSSIRGDDNGINFRTANGNFLEMNDSTIASGECTPGFAGPRRGITAMTTSTHLFQMNDNYLNDQFSEPRKDGGIPKKADQSGFEGYILLRSGYGLQLLMKDQDRQDKTAEQFIQLMAPQIDNTERGPHMMVMQEAAEGPGLVLMRAGGIYYQSSYDEMMEVTGEPEHPASRYSTVTDNWVVDVQHTYFNHNELTIYSSDTYIFLLSGNDCKVEDADSAAGISSSAQSQAIANAQANPGVANSSGSEGPCIYNPIVSKDPWVCPMFGFVHYGVMADQDGTVLSDSRSSNVFVSASKPTGDG